MSPTMLSLDVDESDGEIEWAEQMAELEARKAADAAAKARQAIQEAKVAQERHWEERQKELAEKTQLEAEEKARVEAEEQALVEAEERAPLKAAKVAMWP